MENIIQKYLSKNYELKHNSKKIYCIFSVNTEDVAYYDNVLDEFNILFDLEQDILTKIIKQWVKSVNPKKKLLKYWELKEPNLFFTGYPMINRVMSVTMGSDLVSVNPMEGPVGHLFYMDYQYSGATGTTEQIIENRNSRVYQDEQFTENIRRLYENQIAHVVEENQIIGVSSRKKLRLFD